MPLWPRSARFTCPLHSRRGLFAFPPGVTPALTGRWEPMCVPQVAQASLTDGSAGRQSLTRRGTAAPDGSTQQNHQPRARVLLLKFAGGPILPSLVLAQTHGGHQGWSLL